MKIELEFKLQDFWIGVFWQKKPYAHNSDLYRWHVYICIIPCFPIHIVSDLYAEGK